MPFDWADAGGAGGCLAAAGVSGRTLEELDGMDFGRLWRALAVRGVLKAEEARELQLQGKHTPTPEEWRAIRRNDRCQRITGTD
jgi:hypothetical protein